MIVDDVSKLVQEHRLKHGIPGDEVVRVYVRGVDIFKRMLEEAPVLELAMYACFFNWRPVFLEGELQLDLFAKYPELIFDAPNTTAL